MDRAATGGRIVRFVRRIFGSAGLDERLKAARGDDRQTLSVFRSVVGDLGFFFRRVPRRLIIHVGVIDSGNYEDVFAIDDARYIVSVTVDVEDRDLNGFFLEDLRHFLNVFMYEVFFIGTGELSFFFEVRARVFRRRSFAQFRDDYDVANFHAVEDGLGECAWFFEGDVSGLTR